jgi:hypothetical protein
MVMWQQANNDHEFYGMGINPQALRFQVPEANADHVFYSGNSSSASNELMRITGDGKVGIGTSDPAAALDVDGDAKISGQLEIGYTVESEPYDVPPSIEQEWFCACPAGTKVIGGGWNSQDIDVLASYPSTDGANWIVSANNLDFFNHPLIVYAICARLAND